MHADFAVELGPDASALEMPWRSDNGELRYFDLHSRPELLLEIREAQRFRELGEFLAVLNAPASPLASAKCDVWATREMSAEEEVFGAAIKLASYVDLLLPEEARYSLPAHEEFSRAICALLSKAPEMPSAAEFIVRRCYFHTSDPPTDDSRDGYCITFYLSG